MNDVTMIGVVIVMTEIATVVMIGEAMIETIAVMAVGATKEEAMTVTDVMIAAATIVETIEIDGMIGVTTVATTDVMTGAMIDAMTEEVVVMTVVMTEATTGVMIAITTGGGMMEKTTEGMTVVMNDMMIDVTIEVMIGAMTVSLTEVIAVMTAMNPTAIAVQLERKTTLL